MKNLKIMAVGLVAALGLTAVAAAQRTTQPAPPPTQQNRTMDHSRQMMDHNQMMSMMNDPQMHRPMMEMMNSCHQMMMMHMGDMPRRKRQ